MFILQALCALTMASLCTDVEADWYYLAPNGSTYKWFTSRQKSDQVMKFDERIDDRNYTGTETVYFKVICDSSPVTINSIKVAVKSGKFLLSAESETSNICSGQTSECLGPKQIQEKEFFISVKPNPEFKGGRLTLKLAQAGIIYLINHEGARFFNKTGVRLYSGYLPVKFPEKLPQYKITCEGNCQIDKIWGFGKNFNIALSRYPIKIGKDGCTYCSCTTKRVGIEVFCKKNESSSFDMKSSELYITLEPRGEVLDAEVTVKGGDFKSVEKVDYQDKLLCYHCVTDDRTAKNCKISAVDYKNRECHVCKIFDYRYTIYPECDGRTRNNRANIYWSTSYSFICSCNYDFCNIDAATCKRNGTRTTRFGG